MSYFNFLITIIYYYEVLPKNSRNLNGTKGSNTVWSFAATFCGVSVYINRTTSKKTVDSKSKSFFFFLCLNYQNFGALPHI